ncbi:MAG: hypothetical protein PHX38_12605 [Sulfuricella sp.]|nr:hypothetical protein [Sulfuricella sp.]
MIVRAALVAAAFSAPGAHGGALNRDFEDCRVATDTELGEMRGGFELANGGLQLSFAIERVTYINGALVAVTTLTLPSMQDIAGLQSISVDSLLGNSAATSTPTSGSGNPPATATSDDGATTATTAASAGSTGSAPSATSAANLVTLIQNGPNNSFTLPNGLNLTSAALTTIIQNTLDNQTISSSTIINATLTSQALARSMAMTFTINQALIKAIH